jgi:drug/metabolite transporter (DMT)-like permease
MLRLAAFALMSVIWGLTWLPTKSLSAEIPPILLAGTRFVLAGALFLAWALAAGLPLRPQQPLRLLASTLLITTACYALLFWGIARTPSGLAAVVNLSLMPVFTIAVGALAGEERVSGVRLVALGLGLAGLVLLFGASSASGHGPSAASEVPAGLLAVAGATLSYAVGAILSRPLLRVMAPPALAFWQTFAGGLALLLVSILVEGFEPGRLATVLAPIAMANMAFLVVFGSVVGFSIYLWLMRDWGPFKAGLYAFVSPIVAVAVGVAFAGEPFGWSDALGMALMLGATALVLRPGDVPRSTSERA